MRRGRVDLIGEPSPAYTRGVNEGPQVTRSEMLTAIADRVDQVRRPHPVRVAIDGPDAAGKTTLGDELCVALRARGREVIRASIDGFHRPRTMRYRQGVDSPHGYYQDSFDDAQLRDELLHPLGPGGDSLYRTRVFDHRSDQPVATSRQRAGRAAILIFDGVFLLRPELASAWDIRVLVMVEFDEVIRRARLRDAGLFGSPDEAERRYRTRYIPAQQHYLQAVRPLELADVVVMNDDPLRPLLRLGHRAA